ncbi:hypothetical protein [Dehalogenimonas etheniformans]|uniref:ABM domain-containing protein n=1 Tax=Dehalogenimonas etheniformans TaxID=1536648 RepID=A0A2P5P8C6_9CHLR|nr:hypothetical protein [Dehalogenimonas etheniformans]PPD58548.1 hypothetical protein JP09_001285 [Dehalogenimonas etheniformans]QNT76688.1 hypothetical protein HX448_08335 [Dehalogenimonas etheniformans]
MFARVTVMTSASDKVEEGIKDFRDRMLPHARNLSGFKGGLLLVDRKIGRHLGITMWATEKDMQLSSEEANKLRAAAAKNISATNPDVEMYEVAVQALS